jgi:hypothetical protein
MVFPKQRTLHTTRNTGNRAQHNRINTSIQVGELMTQQRSLQQTHDCHSCLQPLEELSNTPRCTCQQKQRHHEMGWMNPYHTSLIQKLWKHNDFLRFRFRLWKIRNQIRTIFRRLKTCKNLAFSMLLQHCRVIFDFWTFLYHCMLNPDPNPIPV